MVNGRSVPIQVPGDKHEEEALLRPGTWALTTTVAELT